MEVRFDNQVSIIVRLAILATFLVALPCASAVARDEPGQTAPAQAKPEKFWLAGRYDGNHVIVYFNAVKFRGTLPPNKHELAPPVAERFYDPQRLPETYAVRFQKGSNAEHFAVGDKYDLLLDYGKVATVTLTTLVGSEMDEEVGNDSFAGALASLEKHDIPYAMKNYYVLRRHQEIQDNVSKQHSNPEKVDAGLGTEPVRFDIQTQIVSLLVERMKIIANSTERHAADGISPEVEVQAFHLADGSLRYYARAAWSFDEGDSEKIGYALAAWIAPQPTLHILAVQTRSSPYDGLESVLPSLLNVIDLGEGKTGIIVEQNGEDSTSLDLVEYQDGVDLGHMRFLHSIGSGE
jgi:hypothetical protein